MENFVFHTWEMQICGFGRLSGRNDCGFFKSDISSVMRPLQSFRRHQKSHSHKFKRVRFQT